MSDDSGIPAPDTKIGQVGNDEQGQTKSPEEETAKKLVYAMLTSQKELGQAKFEYEMLLEEERLAHELSIFEEVYGALYSEPCLICLDDIYVNAGESLITVFFCCGGFICNNCAQNSYEWGGLEKCPLCREPFTEYNESKQAAQSVALAERGVLWAQKHVGSRMVRGEGFHKQEKIGLEWINKAAAQNFPIAQFLIYTFYRDGLTSLQRESHDKAIALLLKSANSGYAVANSELARFYYNGEAGFEKDTDEAYFRASVASALDDTNAQAAQILGLLHYNEVVAEPSPYLACYYSNIVAKEFKNGLDCYLYSKALQKLSSHMHRGRSLTLGFNVLPSAVFWLRKSRNLGFNDAKEQLEKWGIRQRDICANCAKESQEGEKFKQCSKCKAQWYCSKECQVEAWRAGHKKDCKRASILNFEDYLNAE